MEERSPCGSGGCMTCPFSYNDESEQIQNYGCLPDVPHIIKMKEESGHNWACHGDNTVLCGGFANHLKERRLDLDIKTGGLIDYEVWAQEGPEVAMERASSTAFIQEVKKYLNEELKRQESNWAYDDQSMTVENIIENFLKIEKKWFTKKG
jgi:hypothetical protein